MTERKQHYESNEGGSNSGTTTSTGSVGYLGKKSNPIKCRFFKNGNCLSGATCKFSHDITPTIPSDHSVGQKINIKSSETIKQQQQNNHQPQYYQPPTITTTTNKKSIEVSSSDNNSNNNNLDSITTIVSKGFVIPIENVIASPSLSSPKPTTSLPSPKPSSSFVGGDFMNNNNNHINNNHINNNNINNNKTYSLLDEGFNRESIPSSSFLKNSSGNPYQIGTTPIQYINGNGINNNNNNNNINNNINITTTGLVPKSPLLTQSIALSPTRFTNSLSFLPNSPRNPITGSSPSSPFSPQFMHHGGGGISINGLSNTNGGSILSSSPSPFFVAPLDDLLCGEHDNYDNNDDYDDEDDDDNNYNHDPSGLAVVIDDNYDEDIMDPFAYTEMKNRLYQEQEEKLKQQVIKQQENDRIFKQEQEQLQKLNLDDNNKLQQQQSIAATTTTLVEDNTGNTITSTTTTNNNIEQTQPLSYLDALKLNLPPDYYISYEQGGGSGNSSSNNGNGHHGHHGSKGAGDILCHFHIQGICRNGDSCKYVHGDECQICGVGMLVPGHAEQNKQHITDCLIQQEKFNQRELIKHLECGICYDSIVEKGRRFGLLSHCDHVFCLDCIRMWRGTNTATNTITSNSNSAVRLCPLCRFNSHFIIPADIFVSDEKKQEIIEIYKLKLATIPCKYFNKGKGTCKFGTSCMYAHLNSDGSKPFVRKVHSAYFGDITLHSNQLGMFLPQNLNNSSNNNNNNNTTNYQDDYYDDEDYEDDDLEYNNNNKEGFEENVYDE